MQTFEARLIVQTDDLPTVASLAVSIRAALERSDRLIRVREIKVVRRWDKTDADRFLSFVSPEPNTGCWIWCGTLSRQPGYGHFTLSRKISGPARRRDHAHRASWRIFRGPIPKGLAVCHRCDFKRCVNPDHLWLGTRRGNVMDSILKGRFTLPPRMVGEANYMHRVNRRARGELCS